MKQGGAGRLQPLQAAPATPTRSAGGAWRASPQRHAAQCARWKHFTNLTSSASPFWMTGATAALRDHSRRATPQLTPPAPRDQSLGTAFFLFVSSGFLAPGAGRGGPMKHFPSDSDRRPGGRRNCRANSIKVRLHQPGRSARHATSPALTKKKKKLPEPGFGLRRELGNCNEEMQ